MKAEFPSGGATESRLLDTKKSKQAPKIPHGSSADTKLLLTIDSIPREVRRTGLGLIGLVGCWRLPCRK